MNSRVPFFISTQRALLGMITPNMRAIAIQCIKPPFILRVYFSNEYTEEEAELVRDTTSEIIADFPDLNDIKEELLISSHSIDKLDPLDGWVYMRYEKVI